MDARCSLDNRINLALPTTSERSLDLVLSGDDPSGWKVETLDLPFWPMHGPKIIQTWADSVNCPANLKSSAIYKCRKAIGALE
jgi:hypothetical protein